MLELFQNCTLHCIVALVVLNYVLIDLLCVVIAELIKSTVWYYCIHIVDVVFNDVECLCM